MTFEDQKNILQCLRDILDLAYQRAEPVCCGRPGQECCGSPEPELGPFEQTIMDTLGPAEKVLAESVEAAGNCQGILDTSDHIAEASKMVRGIVALAGDITDEDGATFHKSLLVQFSTIEDFHAARAAGQCRFTVFGGDV